MSPPRRIADVLAGASLPLPVNGSNGAKMEPFTLGVGLTGMRERVRQVGGAFVVEAGSFGTIVRATLRRAPA